METRDQNVTDEIHCLKCKAAVSSKEQGCTACGYSLEGVSLYNPKHFLLLAFLLSGMVPVFLVASNWGRIGDTTRKRRWLFMGFAGYVALFSALILLPDFGRSGSKLLGYLINLPIGYLLREKHRPVYISAISMGAKSTSSILGSIKGFGLTLLALAIPIVGFSAYMTVEESRALALLQEGRCEEAVVTFERIVSWDDEDEYIKYNRGLCYLCLERWEDAAEDFRTYLQKHDDDPDAHAFLGYVLQVQGKQEEADRHFDTAERLDPEVLTRLFGSP